MKTLKTIAYSCIGLFLVIVPVTGILVVADLYNSPIYADAKEISILLEKDRATAIVKAEEYIAKLEAEGYMFTTSADERLEFVLSNMKSITDQRWAIVDTAGKYHGWLEPIPWLAVPVTIYLIFYAIYSSHKEEKIRFGQ